MCIFVPPVEPKPKPDTPAGPIGELAAAGVTGVGGGAGIDGAGPIGIGIVAGWNGPYADIRRCTFENGSMFVRNRVCGIAGRKFGFAWGGPAYGTRLRPRIIGGPRLQVRIGPRGESSQICGDRRVPRLITARLGELLSLRVEELLDRFLRQPHRLRALERP